MPNNKQTWQTAQTRERAYYEGRASNHQVVDSTYADFHAPMWNGLLSRLKELKFEENGLYVDVGCGPNSILAFVPCGIRMGVDPLMPFYAENFQMPNNVEFHTGRIEELTVVPDRKADVVFSMNNIDHIEDIGRAAATLHSKLKQNGFLVVTVNIGSNPVLRVISSLFDVYRIIDPTHTYHFHKPQDVEDALDGRFEMIRFECVDDLAAAMLAKKRQHSKPSRSPLSLLRRCLKFIKNDILLMEKLYLIVFKPVP